MNDHICAPTSAAGASLAATVMTAAVLLLCAGSAQAQGSSVSLYGLVDMSVGSTKVPGGQAIKNADSGKMTTSYFGVKGTEDLGGGLAAIFTLDSFLRADTGEAGRFGGDGFWARNAWVGLSGGFGSVTIGRNTTTLFVQTLVFNAFGDSFGYSPSIRHYFTSGTTTGDTGWSNSVRYNTPRLGGFSGSAVVAAGEGNGGRNASLSGQYFAGPLGLGLAWQSASAGATVDNTKTWQLAGSYNLGVAKLFGQYGNVDNEATGRDYDIWGLGASVPVGAGSALVQYGKIKPSSGASRTTLSLGYDHYISKRTDLYAVFMNDKISGLSGGTSYSAGIRHRF
jgi:predicted porin